MVKFSHRNYEPIQPFETSLAKAKTPEDLQEYLNGALDKLDEHFHRPDRRRNFGLGSFSQHVSPNTGSAARLEWMLKHSGLLESNEGVGVYELKDARLTTLGAKALSIAYKTRNDAKPDSGHGNSSV